MPPYFNFSPIMWYNQPHLYYGYNGPHERFQNNQLNDHVTGRARIFTNVLPADKTNLPQKYLRRKIQIDSLLDKKKIKDSEDFFQKLNDAAKSLNLS